jgi:hypothetical protein
MPGAAEWRDFEGDGPVAFWALTIIVRYTTERKLRSLPWQRESSFSQA